MKEFNALAAVMMLLFLLGLGTQYGCYYDVEEDIYPDLGCDTVNVTYSQVVLPIIDAACYDCHDSANDFGGITLEGYDKLKVLVDNGSLLGVIKREAGWSPMPKNQGPLPDCDIEKIEVWINNGALDN